MTELSMSRPDLVRRGLWLNWLTIGYNVVEAVISVTAGIVAGSVALVSFGVDSGIEVTSSLAAHWRLRSDHDTERRERVERLTHRIIGASFLALAAYVIVESVTTLWQREAPEASPLGLAILVLSLLVMPAIARASRRVARALGSRALEADAAQTSLRLPVGHRPRGRWPERRPGLVVGRSGGRARDGADYREGGIGGYPGRSGLRLLGARALRKRTHCRPTASS
jgi:hypothetical protein